MQLACLHWGENVVTVMCQGFIVLYGEMLARAQSMGLAAMVYQTGGDQDISSQQLVIAGVNGFPPPLAGQLINAANSNRLGAIVVDEAHILVEDKQFRSTLGAFCNQISKIPSTVICLQSATIPPQFEHELWGAIGMEHRPELTRTLRVQSTQRSNLSYQILSLGLPPLDVDSDDFRQIFEIWIALVGPIIQHLLDILSIEEEEHGITTGRGLLYFGSDVLTEKWAIVFDCPAIVGHVSGEERSRIWAAWRAGEHKILCVNKAGYYGVDYPNVKFAVFIEQPWALTDWIQATGRAGRDGEPALCLALIGKPSKRPKSNDGEVFSGKIAVKTVFSLTECLRAGPSRFFDGHLQICSTLLPPDCPKPRAAIGICSWCAQNIPEFAHVEDDDEVPYWYDPVESEYSIL